MNINERLDGFAKLEKNWDSYGGAPIGEKAIASAKAYAAFLLCAQAVPRADGGITIVCLGLGMQLENDIHPDGSLGGVSYDADMKEGP